MKRARSGSAEGKHSRRRVRVGVSACLLGQAVRYDAGHKHNPFVAEQLAAGVELVPVCPEVELGLGIPREPISLVRRSGGIRLLGNETGRDLTRAMRIFAARRVEELAGERLSGYVLKKDSPSCGLARVRILGAGGAVDRGGRGLFAEALIRRFPNLPIEEEHRLADARTRSDFIRRVFAYSRLQSSARRVHPPPRAAAGRREDAGRDRTG